MKRKERNIVLIGMPGCGKSTLGAELAKKLNYDYIDTDIYIEEKSRKSIVELFKIGEDAFRKVETSVIKEAGEKYNTVISTGGGAVKNPKNIENLKKHGIVVFINRPIEHIASDIDMADRPLLKEGKAKLYELYEERYDLYKNSCDVEIINDSTLDETIKKILDHEVIK